MFNNEKKEKLIPNCALCRWESFDLMSRFSESQKKCRAQGSVFCINVYNNEMCKELYEKEEEKNNVK